MPAKLTNNMVDDRLKLAARPIKRLGDVIGSLIAIEWRCLKETCKYIWLATPSAILHIKSGCPKCGNCIKLTNEEVDFRLKNNNRPIKRLDNYSGIYAKIKWKCLKENCNYIWISDPNSVLNLGSGCHQCGKQIKLTNQILDDRLDNRNIKRIGNVSNVKTPILFECLECKASWHAKPGNIMFAKTGCPECKNKNEKIVYNFLKNAFVEVEYHKPIKSFVSTETKKYNVDFYLPTLNVIIEYNGAQHYIPIRFGNITKQRAEDKFLNQKYRDNYIRKFCTDNHITLVEIDGRFLNGKKLKSFLQDELRKILSRCP
jgi:very-short-patch-repair endonuclease